MGNRGAEELLNICILFPFMPVCDSCSLYFFIFMRWGESCPLSCSNPSKTAPTWGGICDTCRKKEGERGERMKKKHGHLFYSSSDNALAAVLGKTTCLCPSSSLMPCADHSCQIYRGADLAGNPFPGLVHRTFVKVLVPAQHKRQQQGEKTGEGEGSELKRVQDPPTSSSTTAKGWTLSQWLTFRAGLLWSTWEAKLWFAETILLRPWSKIYIWFSRILLQLSSAERKLIWLIRKKREAS